MCEMMLCGLSGHVWKGNRCFTRNRYFMGSRCFTRKRVFHRIHKEQMFHRCVSEGTDVSQLYFRRDICFTDVIQKEYMFHSCVSEGIHVSQMCFRRNRCLKRCPIGNLCKTESKCLEMFQRIQMFHRKLTSVEDWCFVVKLSGVERQLCVCRQRTQEIYVKPKTKSAKPNAEGRYNFQCDLGFCKIKVLKYLICYNNFPAFISLSKSKTLFLRKT